MKTFNEQEALEKIAGSITADDEQNCFVAVECFPKNQREARKAEGCFITPEGFTNTALAFCLNDGNDRWKTFEEAKAWLEADGYRVFAGKTLKETLATLFSYKIPIYDCMADKAKWLETYDNYYFAWADYRDMFLSDEEKAARAALFSDLATGVENRLHEH